MGYRKRTVRPSPTNGEKFYNGSLMLETTITDVFLEIEKNSQSM